MTSPPPVATGPMPEPAHPEPPFSSAPVQELLRLIVKAARAHQLYLPNNPIYRGALDALRTGFNRVWVDTNELLLDIGESEIRWFDQPVLAGPKSADNLAWLFYKDGIRALRIDKGFEENEAMQFLTIVQRARKGSPDEDDIVTMLWEADFGHLQYRYVELLSEGPPDLSGGAPLGEATQAASSEIRAATQQAVQESREGGVVRMADFDSTLYFLDEGEIEYLRAEVRQEYEADLRAKVTFTLLDIFEAQADPGVREEVIEHVHTLMVFLLASGHFPGVATVLREARVALNRAADITPDQKQRLESLSERLSAPDALSQLVQVLDDTPVLPPHEEMVELFDQLRPSALATVFQWLARIRNDDLRSLLEAAAGRLAVSNTAELVRLIQAPEREISNEAIRRAGALKAQAAVSTLTDVMTEGEAGRRLVAAQALAEIGSPGALQVLERAIEDSDREVRIAAVRALSGRAYRPALARLETVVKGKAIRDVDLTEKMAFFEGYAALCGDAGIPYLDSTLNTKGFLGRRDDAEIRACAAIALGRIGTPAALASLRRASGEKDVVVRNAVSRALRGSVAV